MDIVPPAKRSQIMGRIRGSNTEPEIIVRKLIHGMGRRFRLHCRDLPGRPDLVFPGRRLAVFVHGCFWHRHENCRLCYAPKSNVEFWNQKFKNNVLRDLRVSRELKQMGWRVATVWECETADLAKLSRKLKKWLA